MRHCCEQRYRLGKKLYPCKRIWLRRIGRWIRRFEKRHGERSVFRNPEMAKRF